MKLPERILLMMISTTALTAMAFAQSDVPGSQDPPGMTRMASYYIADYQEVGFDSHAFPVTTNGRNAEQTVEGKRINIRYNLKDKVSTPSQLQVLRNYQNAVRAAGGQVMYQTEESTTLRIVRSGNETWASVEVGNIPSGVTAAWNSWRLRQSEAGAARDISPRCRMLTRRVVRLPESSRIPA